MDGVPLLPVPPSPVLGANAALYSSTPLAPTRSRSPGLNNQARYGGFMSDSYHDDKVGGMLVREGAGVGLGLSEDGAAPSPPPRRRTPKVTLRRVVLIGALMLLVYGFNKLASTPVRTVKMTRRLSPFLPTAFTSLLRSPSSGSTVAHPILPLLTAASIKWSALLSSQSTTFDKASKAYRSRYSLPPPRDFDKWFAFATQGRNHTLVDEYDSLMADLLPFRSLSPRELRRRTVELAQLPGMSIVSIRSGVAQVHSKSGKYAPAVAFQQMLGAFVRDLPDMDIAINEKPEGRVLPRRERTVLMEDYGLDEQERMPNMTDPMITPSLNGFKADWRRDGSVWEAYRRACPTESPSRRLIESLRSSEVGVGVQVEGRARPNAPLTRRRPTAHAVPSARELTFQENIDAHYDVCARPSIHSLHSAFFSDQRSIEYLYPVFSPSKPSGYADILIPSHHYWTPGSEFTYEWEMKRGLTNEPTDIEWEDKSSTIYWRGKVTRGAETPPGHAGSFQKQRLVMMANEAPDGDRRVLVSFDKATASLTSASAPIDAVNKAVSDIAMACEPTLGECVYLKSLGYRVEQPRPLNHAWRHKYVLDLDEIGHSPRFLALMESKSAVIKSSVQREFWQGWAVPWKHYIPLSTAYAELYNIRTFFSGFPTALTALNSFTSTVLTKPHPVPELPTTSTGESFDGDRALQDIAEAGRDWRQNHVRKGDMECYVYRLMIEWAAMTTLT